MAKPPFSRRRRRAFCAIMCCTTTVRLLIVLTLPPRYHCALNWLAAPRLLLPRSGLERSNCALAQNGPVEPVLRCPLMEVNRE